MVDNHNPDHNESKPLNTELETLAPEATADHAVLSSTSTPTQQHESVAAESTIPARSTQQIQATSPR